jgi:hypothetical protein
MRTQQTTYQQTQFLSEILNGGVIPEGKLAYFRARLSNSLHELVLSTFLKTENRDGLTRAELAKRLGRKPEQITRWFASPGNWELETVSDLLLGMGYEPDLSVVDLRELAEPQVREESTQLAYARSESTAANDPKMQPSGPLGSAPAASSQTQVVAKQLRCVLG